MIETPAPAAAETLDPAIAARIEQYRRVRQALATKLDASGRPRNAWIICIPDNGTLDLISTTEDEGVAQVERLRKGFELTAEVRPYQPLRLSAVPLDVMFPGRDSPRLVRPGGVEELTLVLGDEPVELVRLEKGFTHAEGTHCWLEKRQIFSRRQDVEGHAYDGVRLLLTPGMAETLDFISPPRPETAAWPAEGLVHTIDDWFPVWRDPLVGCPEGYTITANGPVKVLDPMPVAWHPR